MNILLSVVLAILIIAVFGKWILIGILFPFQVMANRNKLKPIKIGKVLAMPYKMWEKLFRGGWARFMLHEVAYIPSHHLRRFIYKALGMQMGKNNVFHYGAEIRNITEIRMGGGNQFGDNVILDGRRGIEIGNNVNVSSNVSIWTLQHDHRDPNFDCRSEGGKVVVEDRVWLGCNVIVLPGVIIGEGAVCCAGCVVTKNVDPFSVVAGIPAKKVNERPRNMVYKLTDKTCRLL